FSMTFSVLFKWFCIISCIVSWLFNGLLCFIVHRQRAGVGFYRFFTYSSVLIGVLYSFSFAVAQPFWYAGPGMLGFFSTAPWNDEEMIIRVAFQFWFATFWLILVCMSCSFAYRYGMLSSTRIVSWFERPRRFLILSCFLLVRFTYSEQSSPFLQALSVIWLYNSNFFLFGDSKQVDLMTSYVLTVNINV
ncbi:hypothetical protein PENTCL1PPCAC_23721, partial [Pristionchus entomophagus]